MNTISGATAPVARSPVAADLDALCSGLSPSLRLRAGRLSGELPQARKFGDRRTRNM